LLDSLLKEIPGSEPTLRLGIINLRATILGATNLRDQN